MMRNEAFRKSVWRLVSGGLPQIKVSLRVRRSRERIRQICNEIFGKAVAVEKNRVSRAGGLFDSSLRQIKKRKRIKCLLWVAEEAMRRGLEVGLLLNPKNEDHNVILINGMRVNVQVAVAPMTTAPFYHWEVRETRM